ncbi:flagellar biosynthetic protein FliO [Lysinibacillus sp. 54212]|uniref:flagellar biosynthetic protein FliO n=1 Tax=Lysinibacillus sp. 54212 TaxID=3119829 RepID=UPI002FC5FD51
MVFALLLVMNFVVPTQFVAASQGNQMITDCIEDKSKCEDSDVTDAETEGTESASGMGLLEYIKILLSLVFVIGLLIAVLKFLNKRNLNYQQNSVIRNIGGLSVGAQKSVQLLHIGDRLYIVGVGEDVHLLNEIKDPNEIAQILKIYNDKQSNASTSPYIAELFAKFKTKKAPVDEQQNGQGFSEILDKRLSEIKKERSDELERWKEKENDKK